MKCLHRSISSKPQPELLKASVPRRAFHPYVSLPIPCVPQNVVLWTEWWLALHGILESSDSSESNAGNLCTGASVRFVREHMRNSHCKERPSKPQESAMLVIRCLGRYL